MMPESNYEEQEATLAPGDSVLFYSNGLVEAHNSKRDMFGFPHLMSLLGEHSCDTTLIDFLLGELATFTRADWEQEDDVTMVVLDRAAFSVLLQKGWWYLRYSLSSRHLVGVIPCGRPLRPCVLYNSKAIALAPSLANLNPPPAHRAHTTQSHSTQHSATHQQ